jgi:macrodomain Ter protein organizer (MatP/YcbG family)
MTKAINTFSDNYDIQESWIRRQVDSFKDDSFVDLELAKNEIEDAGIAAFATPKDVDVFRSKHLSDIGLKRLSSALRTYKKRSIRRLTTRRLDIDISLPAYLALEALVREQELTKIQLIERLVLDEKEKSDNVCDSVTEYK